MTLFVGDSYNDSQALGYGADKVKGDDAMTTSTRQKRLGISGFVVAAVVAATASLAWACTGLPQINVDSRRAAGPDSEAGGDIASGPPGTRVFINGTEFGSGPVELRWDSMTGKLLATTTGPSFSVAVTIPQATPGVYTILAVQSDDARNATGQARTPFEVTNPSAEPGTSATPTVGGGAAQGSNTRTRASGADTQGSTGAAGAGDEFAVGGTVTSSEPSQSTLSNSPPGVGAGQSSSGSAASSATGATASPARSGLGGATAPTAATAPTEAGALVPVPGEESLANTASNLQRTVSADLWGGFQSGTISLNGGGASEPATTQGPWFALGMGLLVASAGLIAMLGGFAVAEVRRRRPVTNTGVR